MPHSLSLGPLGSRLKTSALIRHRKDSIRMDQSPKNIPQFYQQIVREIFISLKDTVLEIQFFVHLMTDVQALY